MGQGVVFRKLNNGIEIKSGAREERSYKQHLHEELSIGLVMEGETVVAFDHESISMKSGMGLIIPALFSHLCAPFDPEHWAYKMIYIDTALYDGDLSFSHPRILNEDEIMAFKELMVLSEQIGDPFLTENQLIDLLMLIHDEQTCSQNYNDPLLDKIHDHIRDHFTESMTLDILAEGFDINKYALIRKFKNIYNTTPGAFQLQLKVAHGKTMLADGASVHDVVSAMGFYDQAHFIREFRKMNGTTPSSYQKLIIGQGY